MTVCLSSTIRGDKTGAPNPTDKGKLGTKRHILTDKNGIPLSVVITAAANTHDMKAVGETLDNVVIKRSRLQKYMRQHLCLDKGYDFPEIEREVIRRKYIPHISRRGEKKKKKINREKKRRRRWVVERTNSWHNRFRKLLIRYEKKSDNYFGLVQLACCIIVYRRILWG